MKNRRQNWIKKINIIVPFLGPTVFEIVNGVTGNWTTESQKLNVSNGKIITAIVGIVYIVAMIFILYYNEKGRKSEEDLQEKVNNQEKKIKSYEDSNKNLCDLLAFLNEKVKLQIDYLKENGKIDVRSINIDYAATNAAKMIHQSIMNHFGQDVKATVNVYHRIIECGKKEEYSIMVAHEGNISQPSVFGQRKVLRHRKGNRYCEKIMLSNDPDYRILLTREEVSAAFGIQVDQCKYNQYIGIPIRKKGGINIGLIECVVHDDMTLWKTKDEARQFATHYFENLKEYILLVDRLYEQGEVVASRLDGGKELR